MSDHNDPHVDHADPTPTPSDEATATSGETSGQEPTAAAHSVITERPVIATGLLSAHPGNIRRDLHLNTEFVASVAANGILVPLRVAPDGDGFRVIDGHRRLAAAIQAGLAEVPVDVATDRAGDDPGQFLDMWTAHRHRAGLAPIEEADALFAASQAGATRARIRKTTGLKAAGVTSALAAAKLSGDTRARLEDAQLSLDQLAVMAEFEDDAQAITRLTTAAAMGRFEHEAEWQRQRRADQAEHDRLRAGLTAAGYVVTDALPPGACYVTSLLHDDQDLTAEAHAACPGRGVFFRAFDLTEPVHYCSDPAGNGHVYRYARSADGASTSSGATQGGASGGTGVHDPGADVARRLVIQGNKAWTAAGEVRKRWLATLLARRTAPREATQFAARELLAMGDPLRSGLPTAPGRQLLADLAGHPVSKLIESCDTAVTGRLPLLILAPVVTAYEAALTDGEGRNTWRTDKYAPCPRPAAGRYFTFLASVGYHLSGIEQAVADNLPWTGDTPPGDLITDIEPHQPDSDAGSDAVGGSQDADDEPAGTGPGSADAAAEAGEGISQAAA